MHAGQDSTVLGSGAPRPIPDRAWSDLTGSATLLAVAIWLAASAPALSLAVVPAVLYELFFALAFLTRGRARATLTGWGPRVTAIVGTFLVPAMLAISGAVAPQWVAPITQIAPSAAPAAVTLGAMLTVAGAVISAWGLWHLRASVSLVAAARGLVTTGPYRIARHPLYLAYILSYVGVWLTHPTVALTLTMAVWFVVTLARVRYEERILTSAFPEYAPYRERVGAFGPRITGVI